MLIDCRQRESFGAGSKLLGEAQVLIADNLEPSSLELMSMQPQQPTVVFFCMPERGHFQALRAVVARVAAAGMAAYVFTHRSFQEQVEQAGGTFVDLFSKHPIDVADDESTPIPCRFVSFAGHYGEAVIEEVRLLNPSLMIYDSFTVIGLVVARALGVPHVSVCANHNASPARCLAELRNDKRVAVSPKCHRAVERLRTRLGLTNASPFSYVTSLSPLLNIYCEPSQFLDDADRAAFAPFAFFGCLADDLPAAPERSDKVAYFVHRPSAALRVYISFGTVIWRYFANEAIAALKALCGTFGKMEHASVVVSLWGAPNPSGLATSLENKHVRVAPYLNQVEILHECDLFVTHHGLNSTHEAIRARVAMISYPFFWDQPALARKCQELGLAIALTDGLRKNVTAGDVEAAVTCFLKNRSTFAAKLRTASAWEEETIAQRDLVVDKIWEIMQPGSVPALLRAA
jgi:MGT family glycosyltransferase